MSTTNYPGQNYALGQQTNCHPKTGIRYGVISSHKLGEFAWDEIADNGTDLDHAYFIQTIKDELRSALKDYFRHSRRNQEASPLDNAVENAFEAINDDLNYEQPGDCTRYLYEAGGLRFEATSDGDIFVLESPCVTFAQFCSPCAPGACYLANPLGPDAPNTCPGNRCYCLPADWFDDEKAPYPIYTLNPDGTTKL